jgi:hypothetical protein
LDINNAWESIRENIMTSAKESLGYHWLKQNKPWFDDECSKLIDQRKQAKLQWLQNQSQIIGDNLQNLRLETSRTFRKKKREHLKDKINELETNNKNENIRHFYRGINEFKKGYYPRINIIKDENANLLAHPHSALNSWKHFFNRVLNVHGVYDFRQMDVHVSESLVPESGLVEVEIAIGKLRRYKSPATNQIPTELIKAGGETLCSEIHKLLVLCGIRSNCYSSGRNLLLYQFIKMVIRLTVIIIEELPSYKIVYIILLARLTLHGNEIIGDHQCGFRRNGSTTNQMFYIR